MLVIDYLGFICIFVVFPVIGLILRRKWRLEVANREEISRLLDFGTDDAAVGYCVAPPPAPPVVLVVSPRVCAVCYTVTSNRCARCKSVNYCSGKCQIIHWRQGHKDECQPLSVSSEINDEESSFVRNAQGETALEGHRFSNSAVSSPYVPVKDDDAEIGKYPSIEEPDLIYVHHDSSISSEVPASSPGHNIPISESTSDDDCLHNPDSESCDSSSTFDKNSRHIEQIKPLENKSYVRADVKGGISVARCLKNATVSGKTSSSDLRDSYSVANNVEPSISTSGFWDGTLNSSKTGIYVPNNNAKPRSVGAGNKKLPALKSHVQLSSDSSGLSSDTHLKSPEPVDHDPGVASTAKVVVKTISASKESVAALKYQSSKGSSKQLDGGIRNVEKAILAYDSFVKLYWNKVEFLPCGLFNCGNSCYANVVLQCLTFTPPLTSYLLQGLHSKACVKKDWCFTCEFERLVLRAKELGYPQSPTGILSHIQKIGSHLTNGREEDAHEFLRYTIETMQSICLQEAVVKDSKSLEEETTLVGLTFGGYLRSKIKCTRCHGKSVRQERMMDLTVEIEGDIQTLEDALQQFTRTESLDGENKYHCVRCKSYEKAKKKLNILEAPNILTIALKRFQSGKFGKLNKAIQFPEILNLAPYMRGGSDKAPIYRLYGVVVHLDKMNASFTGHYVCYVRNAHNKWFKIDDSMVKPVELDKVLNMGAYMLLYSRCSPRAPRSIRSTIVSRDLPSKIKNPAVDASRGRGLISTSRQRDLPAHTNHDPVDLSNLGYIHDEKRPSLLRNNQDFDSSSDNSSIFSNSDVVSTSTDGTQESNTADDTSVFNFYRNAFSRPSDSDSSSSSSSSSSSPEYMKRSPLSYSERYASALPEHNFLLTDNSKASHETFLHSNSSSQIRNPVNISSDSDAKRLGRANPLDNGYSGVHLRRSSRKRAD